MPEAFAKPRKMDNGGCSRMKPTRALKPNSGFERSDEVDRLPWKSCVSERKRRIPREAAI
jgi:hypothetical protein